MVEITKREAEYLRKVIPGVHITRTVTCGKTMPTTPRATGKTACPYSPAMNSRTRSSSALWSVTPTSSALPAMCVMPIPALRTA